MNSGTAQPANAECKVYAFVTNPGDEGHVDPHAPFEVQEQQRARRKELIAEFMAKAKEDGDGQPH